MEGKNMNNNLKIDDSLFGTDYDSTGALTSSGDIATVTGLDNAKQSIKNWLLTDKGLYPSIDEEYGSQIRDILGETLTDTVLKELISYIEDALLANPRVKHIVSITSYSNIKGEIIIRIKAILVNGSEENFNINLSEVE